MHEALSYGRRRNQARPVPFQPQVVLNLRWMAAALIILSAAVSRGAFTNPISPAIAAAPGLTLFNYRLSHSLGDSQDVSSYRLSPDGSTVVYSVMDITGLQSQIYSVPLNRSRTPVLLGQAAPLAGAYDVTADSRRVIFIGPSAEVGLYDLFSVPISGGQALRLNDPLPENGSVVGFVLDSGGQRVVYQADQERDNAFELFSVPVGGGTAVRLNHDLGEQDTTLEFDISASGDWLAYRAWNADLSTAGLYSVPVEGGTAVLLNADLDGTPNVMGFVLSPQEDVAAYRVRNTLLDLYSVPLAGGSSSALNLDPSVRVTSNTYAFTADGSRVLYLAMQQFTNPFNYSIQGLYSVPVAGGLADKLVESPSTTQFIRVFKTTPDSTSVVYLGDMLSFGQLELFSLPLSGGTPTRLNRDLPQDGGVSGFRISPNSDTVVYTAEQNSDALIDLFSVPTTGGDPIQLNAPLGPDQDVLSFVFSPDGSQAGYAAGQAPRGPIDLFSVDVSGGQVTHRNPALVESSGVDEDSPIFTTDNLSMLYLADQENAGIVELFFSTYGTQLFLPFVRH